MASYPETVVERVTHPLGGLPGKLKWPPAIAEVRDACEAEMKPYHDQMRRQRLEAERMAALPAPLEDRKASLARVKARAPEIWPNDGAKQQVRAQENLAKLCREAGVDPASLADRPGAPVRGWKRLDVSEMMPGTAE